MLFAIGNILLDEFIWYEECILFIDGVLDFGITLRYNAVIVKIFWMNNIVNKEVIRLDVIVGGVESKYNLVLGV